MQATSTLGRKARLPGIDVSLVLVVQTASSLGPALVLIYCFQVFMSLFFFIFRLLIQHDFSRQFPFLFPGVCNSRLFMTVLFSFFMTG